MAKAAQRVTSREYASIVIDTLLETRQGRAAIHVAAAETACIGITVASRLHPVAAVLAPVAKAGVRCLVKKLIDRRAGRLASRRPSLACGNGVLVR